MCIRDRARSASQPTRRSSTAGREPLRKGRATPLSLPGPCYAGPVEAPPPPKVQPTDPRPEETSKLKPAMLRGEAHEASAHRETICFSHTAAAQAAPSGPEGHSEGAFESGEGESPRRHVLTRRLRNRDWGRIVQWRPNPAQHRLTRTSRSVNLPGRGSNRKHKSAPANRAQRSRVPRGVARRCHPAH